MQAGSTDPPIPLRDLSRSQDSEDESTASSGQQPGRQRSLLRSAGIGRLSSSHRSRKSYDRIPGDDDHHEPIPHVSHGADLQVPRYDDGEGELPSITEFRHSFERVLGGAVGRQGSWLPPRNLDDPVSAWPADAPPSGRASPVIDATMGDEGDMAPLADVANQQPMSGFVPPSPTSGRRNERFSAHSVRFAPGSSLGDDLHSAEEGLSSSMSAGGGSLSRSDSRAGPSQSGSSSSRGRSLSPSASPVRRVSVAVRHMSQRVVNLSNDPEAVENATKRRALSKSGHSPSGRSVPDIEVHPYDEGEANEAEEKPTTPLRRPSGRESNKPWHEQSNPLKGKSLRIFSPANPLRLFLCDVLIHPATEPLILLLIVIQTILLTVDSAPDVFNDPRSKAWGTSPIDYALLVLFVIYTMEITARCIVSGLILNPKVDDRRKPRRGFRERIADTGHRLLSPRRQTSIRAASPSRGHEPPSLLRSITNLNLAEGTAAPTTVQSQARFRLARKAFLRHSFNRLDLLAVCSYWISLVLCLAGLEAQKHIFVFRMMSCLRILRLLGITSGTSVILRSLKKAAPLLVHVAFLIGFFWLVFAIVGVQSFKGSFRRECVWVDPSGVQSNYTQSMQFCGGHLNAATGEVEPYVDLDGKPGATSPKGYICPANSFCVTDSNPYGGTLSFDNVLQSLELVFVVMSANTYSSLIYWTADSDYLAGSLFFVFGIVILAFWLANLLIAVITSSFQVIREESSKSAFSAAEETSSIREEDTDAPKKPNALRRVYNHSHHFWVTVIAISLLAQTFRSSDMTTQQAKTIDRIVLAVSVLLIVDIVLRFASDWRHFHQQHRNWADFLIAVMSCVTQLPGIHDSGRAYDWLTIFQILPIYRLVWAVPVTRNLLAKVLGNVSGLSNLLVFTLLVTFLCAILAAQLVRGDLPAQYDGDDTQASFYTIYNAFLGMYQILSSENWTTILWMATDVQSSFGTGWISAMFFVGWFIFGNFIVLNMFIAVIQENFDVTEDEKRMYQVKTFLQNKSYKAPSQGMTLLAMISSRWKKNQMPEAHSRQAAFEMLTKQAVVESFLDEGEHRNRQSLTQTAPMAVAAAVENLHLQEEKKQRVFQRWYSKIAGLWQDKEPNPFYSFQSRSLADLAPTAMAQEVVTEQERRKKAQREYLAKHPNYNVSLFIFRPTNPVRKLCQLMVGPSRGDVRYDGLPPYTPFSYSFSVVVYCAIVAMVILACITTPLYQKEYLEKYGAEKTMWFTYVDAGFVALFTLESAIKIIADGLLWTPNAYLRGSWGIIDCIVLITLWISVISSLRKEDQITRAVGAFKALRALRLLNISGSTQDTFHSVVIVGGQKIVSAAFVSLSLIIPFAIYGVNLFSGSLETCNDSSADITKLSDCVHEYAASPANWDVLAPRAVDNPYYDFDSFGDSLFILFQIVSQEGWVDVMYDSMNIVGKGLQPQTFASQGNAVFFLVFNLLGAVFVLTLFVSVFMRNYTEQTGVAFLTADQRTWLELRKRLRQVRPSKRPNESPDSDWQSWCYKRATHKHGWWQRVMTGLLILHGILLLLEYHPAPPALDTVRNYLFLGLTLTYIINILVRIVGLTWQNFLKSGWDLYGLFSVSGTFVTTLLLLAGYVDPTFIQLQKLFLVSIIMMLIPRNNQLDHLFKTAAASLGVIGSLMMTWFVLFLVYAIAMTQTFGLTKIGPNGGDNMNFRTIPKALIMLFIMTTGEGWNQIMSDFEIDEPQCVRGETFFDTDCGSGAYARVLFVSWNILSMYIFVSMFISLIFESFSYVYQRSGDSSAVSREEIRKFKNAWSKFDPDGTGYISKDKFPRLLGQLTGVFAMRIYEEPYTVEKILEDVRTDPQSTLDINRPIRGIVDGVDLDALNRKISMIPVHKIRRQRHTFTLFFEECLVSADKDYGVSFTSVLLILAHYKIINDNKSLRLEEYLRRRYRLQRVEEQVQRNVVTNFFLTFYWSKRFRNARSGASTASVSVAKVPQIRIEDGGSSESTSLRSENGRVRSDSIVPQITLNEGPVTPSKPAPPPLNLSDLSPVDDGPMWTSSSHFGDINPFANSEQPTGLRQRPGRRTPPNASPLVSPGISPGMSPVSPTLSPIGSPRFGPTRSAESPEQRPRSRGETSDVAPQIVLDALDSSEWRDQIRTFIENRQSQNPGGSSRNPSVKGK